jgi:hypothetical protein
VEVKNFRSKPANSPKRTRVLDFGALKYEPHSWQSVEVERYNAAARRHRLARDLGEERDPESGLLHLAHEATNLLFQLEMKCREIDVGFRSSNEQGPS